jgi:hypothetical protein
VFFLTKKYWLSWKKIGEGVLSDITGGSSSDSRSKKDKHEKNKQQRDASDIIEDYEGGGNGNDESPES